jgi:hypothetical protein
MEYKKGHKIKPDGILSDGRVIFTDGTNTVLPNQISCEAYGYKWNKKEGTCTAFNYTNKIARLNKGISVTKTDKTNIEEGGTRNTTIIGVNNTTKGQNKNVLISGESHEVDNGINNATTLGANGKVKNQGELVLGGGIGTSDAPLGNNQTSIVQLGGLTSDASRTNLTVHGAGTDYITVQNNSILGFEVKVIGLCYGGSSGTAGDYKYAEIKGAVQVDDGYNLTWSQSTTTIASVGTTGTVQMAAVSDPYITVEATGSANVNIEWFASVQITENKLYSVTF